MLHTPLKGLSACINPLKNPARRYGKLRRMTHMQFLDVYCLMIRGASLDEAVDQLQEETHE